MRKIINSTYITMDGIIQNPQDWPSFMTGNDEASYSIQWDLLSACDAVLMGRHTYNSFAAVWPTMSGDALSDRMNSATKYVVSTTLQNPSWNNTTVISDDSVVEIRKIKDQAGMNIVQYGFGRLAFALMEHGLLDELRLWIHPFFLGKGGPEDLLFRNCSVATFDLTGTTTLKGGIIILNYSFHRP